MQQIIYGAISKVNIMKIVKVENSLFTGKIENFVIKINTSIIWNKYKINNGFVFIQVLLLW